MLDAVVEVDLLAQVGVVVDLLLIGVDLVELILQALELLLVLVLVGLRGSRVDALLVSLDARLVELLLLVDVARAQARHPVAVVAVDVDERFEAVLPARIEEPVDRPLLVGLAVILVEVVEEVAADVLERAALAAERVREELQVLLIVLLAVDRPEPGAEAVDDVVLEVLVIADRDDVVLVRSERGILRPVERPASIGKARHIERIAAKHAADRIREQRLHDVRLRQHVVVALHRLGDVVLRVVDASDRHILARNAGRQLILQAVDVDKDAVELFLVGLECQETLFTVRLKRGITVSNRQSDCCREHWMALEIPRGFEDIDIFFRNTNIMLCQHRGVLILFAQYR